MANRSPETRQYIVALTLFFWLASVLAAYFWVHKPILPEQVSAPLTAAADFVLATWVVAVAGGIGQLFLGDARLSSLGRVSVGAALGLGVVSFVVLGIGIVGWLSGVLFYALMFFGTLIFRRSVRTWLHDLLQVLREATKAHGVHRFTLLISGILVLFGLLLSLAPPLKWDSLVYHLEVPRQYLAAGKIIYLDDNLFIGLNLLAEMVYMLAMGLRGGSTALVVGWWVGVLALLATEALARQLFGDAVRWFAPFILLSGASVSQALSWAYVDLWGLMYGAGAFFAIFHWLESRNPRWLWFVGGFVGLGIATKPTGLIVFAGLLVVMLGAWKWPPQRDDVVSTVRRWIGIGLLGLLISSPWLLKNVWLTGNPLYPLVFPARDVDGLRLMFHQSVPVTPSLMDVLLLPWQATILGTEGRTAFGSSIGPLLLAFLPAAFLGWRGQSVICQRNVRILLGVFFVLWMIFALGSSSSTHLQQSRLYYPLFSPLAALSAWGLSRALRFDLPQLQMGFVVRMILIFAGILVLVEGAITTVKVNPLPVLAGAETENEYLVRNLGWYQLATEAVNDLKDARVLFLWETRAYYCEVECSPDVILDRWWYARQTLARPAEIAAHFRTQGFTHLLVYDVGADYERDFHAVFYTEEDWQALDTFISDELTLVQRFDDVYSLYAFNR